MDRWESPVDKAIREAQERGEFDNLPGAGRPLRSLTEQSVRAVLEDYNHRVREDRLRPGVGPRSPVWARIVDIEELVDQWRTLREERRQAPVRAAEAAAVRAAETSGAARRGRAGWIRRLLGRW